MQDLVEPIKQKMNTQRHI